MLKTTRGERQTSWIRDLVESGRSRDFYRSRRWKRVRIEVLKDFKNECQFCKKAGRYRKATVVHHVYHLDDYPEWGLSKTVVIDGEEKINLIATCRDCHENEHEHLVKKKDPPLTPERW